MFRAHPKPWAGKKETHRFGRAFVCGGSISLFQPMLPPYGLDSYMIHQGYSAVNLSRIESKLDT